MKAAWAVCKREFKSYFTTPVGYVIAGTFAFLSGLGFTAGFIFYCRVTKNPPAYAYTGVPDLEETMLSPFLVFCGQLIMFIGPLLTMRLLAEEKNRGTAELLFTYPLRDREIVLGKFAAALGMLLVMMAAVAVQLSIMSYYTDVEPAVLLFGLLTVFLMGAAFVGLGLFVSAMTSNQVTAGTLTLGTWFISYVLGSLGEDLPEHLLTPERFGPALQKLTGLLYGIFRDLVTQLPLDAHAREMAQGIFQPKDVAYYVLFTVFFLFLTLRALESRKWKG
ncbi:MAG: ABC transporter permease subunit [Candidatus Hydrogenedentes bacterium]|nr:ABC transporter permease subunit [Candidatus Hydrogenedentota bacterium]